MTLYTRVYKQILCTADFGVDGANLRLMYVVLTQDQLVEH